MDVTALCIQIFINVFVLLSTQPGSSYMVQKPGLPTVSPDKLQFFEYESIFLSCGGDREVNAWRVMRKLHIMSLANESENCSVPAPSCIISHAFERHSGEYWCENDEGERSRSLNISVTVGSVILNLPSQPVKDGSDVTLQCFNKNTMKTEAKHISDFYKDGHHLGTYYETNMILSKVSKSDEGLYKCSISKAGESPESWLAVVVTKEKDVWHWRKSEEFSALDKCSISGAGESPESWLTVFTPKEKEEEEGSNEGTRPSMNLSLIIIILLVIIFSLLFLVIGFILYNKYRALKNESVSDPKDTTYALVKKPRHWNGGDTANIVSVVTYAAVEIWKKAGSKVSTATTLQYSSDQELLYPLIDSVPTQQFS